MVLPRWRAVQFSPGVERVPSCAPGHCSEQALPGSRMEAVLNLVSCSGFVRLLVELYIQWLSEQIGSQMITCGPFISWWGGSGTEVGILGHKDRLDVAGPRVRPGTPELLSTEEHFCSVCTLRFRGRSALHVSNRRLTNCFYVYLKKCSKWRSRRIWMQTFVHSFSGIYCMPSFCLWGTRERSADWSNDTPSFF